MDDVLATPGRCRTDHWLAKGETIYVRDGRAIVRSCRTDRAVDDTYRRNARALRILNLEKPE